MEKTKHKFIVAVLAAGMLFNSTSLPEASNCYSLNSINIKSNKLKSVGNNAIKGIKNNASIKCYKGKKTAYKKLFSPKTGYKDTMKLK